MGQQKAGRRKKSEYFSLSYTVSDLSQHLRLLSGPRSGSQFAPMFFLLAHLPPDRLPGVLPGEAGSYAPELCSYGPRSVVTFYCCKPLACLTVPCLTSQSFYHLLNNTPYAILNILWITGVVSAFLTEPGLTYYGLWEAGSIQNLCRGWGSWGLEKWQTQVS